MKKYTVSYCSGATGYGWEKSYDRLDEFEDFVDEMRSNYTAQVYVWDNTLNDFIFYKRALSYKPEIDRLSDVARDFRTTTREVKEVKYRNWIEQALKKHLTTQPVYVGYNHGRKIYELSFENGESKDFFIDFEKKLVEEV